MNEGLDMGIVRNLKIGDKVKLTKEAFTSKNYFGIGTVMVITDITPCLRFSLMSLENEQVIREMTRFEFEPLV